MQNNRLFNVSQMCGYQAFYNELSKVKFCQQFRVLVAIIQVTNIDKCSVGFRGCFFECKMQSHSQSYDQQKMLHLPFQNGFATRS